MKKIFTLLLLICSLTFLNAQNLLNNPESVVYDSVYDRYLVSNCGDGMIVQIDNTGQQSYFNTELSIAVGLHIAGDTLFVSSNGGPHSGIVGFLLATGEIIFHVQIPEKVFLNDIATDNSGNLYVTDNDANKIFKVNRSSLTYTTLVDDGLGYPNGILYDEQNNRLMVLNCLLSGMPILSISLDDLSVTTIVETGINSIDGFTEDNYGNYYFSSWATDRVYRYDPFFTHPPEIIAGGFTNPADIFYNKTHHVLAIPCFNADTLILFPHNPVNIDDSEKENTGLLHVFPNPFTEKLNIQLELSNMGFTSISVYDVNGRLIENLPDMKTKAGISTMHWDGSAVKPGVYFLSVLNGDVHQVHKIVKK